MTNYRYTFIYAGLGAAFGVLFPVFSWWFDAMVHQQPFTGSGIANLHQENPIHFVIDSAPIFLGAMAAIAGYRQDLLYRINNSLANKVEENAIELSKTTHRYKQIESHKEEIEEDYSRANSDLARFSYILAHDLKAPLVAINNLSEWIEEELSGSFSKEASYQFNLLRGRVARMNMLLESMQEYFAVSNSNLNKQKSIEIAVFIKEIAKKLNIPNSVITVTSEVKTLTAHEKTLRKLFHELIENAYTHNHKKEKRIEILIQKEEKFFKMMVIDNGDGIDPQFHKDAFELLKTIEARDKLNTAGVGLAIAKRIVELNNGSLELSSTPSVGTTFTITWPLTNN